MGVSRKEGYLIGGPSAITFLGLNGGPPIWGNGHIGNFIGVMLGV